MNRKNLIFSSSLPVFDDSILDTAVDMELPAQSSRRKKVGGIKEKNKYGEDSYASSRGVRT